MNGIGFKAYMQESGEVGYLPSSKEFGDNNVVVFVNPNILVSRPDLATNQYSLNHEAGHFVYWAANTTAYILYRLQLEKDNKDNMGGHRSDDLSGQKALKYGKIKDIE